MTPNSKFLISLVICGSLSACVTTREQYNQERGIYADGELPGSTRAEETRTSRSVRSEELPAKSKVVSEDIRPESSAGSSTTASAPPTAPAGVGARSDNETGSANTSTATLKQITERDTSNYGAEELRSEVAQLNGKVEELEHDRQMANKDRESEQKKAQDRIVELEKKLKELQPDAPKVPEGKTPLEAGKDAFLADKYDDTILFMNQVLEKNESGKEAEEATYIRGEAYFKKQLFNKAIVDFSHFPEKFQKSTYHPKALLRIAESFEMMGRKDDAKAFYSDLVDKYPKTAEGKLAKKRLKIKK